LSEMMFALSASLALPLKEGTQLIAAYPYADCMKNSNNYAEYEDWVVSSAESSGMVVQDGTDAAGNHHDKLMTQHCQAVMTTKPAFCMKDEVPVTADVSHLNNVKKLCKVFLPTAAAPSPPPDTPPPSTPPPSTPPPMLPPAAFQSTTTYTALQSWRKTAAPTAAVAALGGRATIQTQGTAFGEASLAGYCGDTGAGVAPGVGGAMRSTASTGNKIHCWDNLNDGLMGNSNSWIPGSANKKAGVYFTSAQTMTGLGLARDAVGQYSDRGGDWLVVEVSYTPMSTAAALTGTKGWSKVGALYPNSWAVAGQITWWKFASSLNGVYAIRIWSTGAGACIDELQIVS